MTQLWEINENNCDVPAQATLTIPLGDRQRLRDPELRRPYDLYIV
jgi:hypothetical protein